MKVNVGHFSYLLSGAESPQTKVAADRLELLAKTAAKRFLEETIPLNTSIRKFAEENDLNRNQIERVCEMANIATHRGLWAKTAEKETVAFDLADAKTVVNVVKPTEDGTEPVTSPSSVDSDFLGPPKGLPCSGPSTTTLMGADPEKVHNGLTEVPEKKRIIIILQKKAESKKVMQGNVIYKGMELESLEKKGFNAVKQEVLGGRTFRELYAAAAAADLSKMAMEYFPKWQQELVKQTHGEVLLRLTKEAIHRAPEELISDDLGNTAVVNGSHPVLVSLDTIQRKTGEIKQGLNNLLRIDDEVKIFNQRLRELS